MKKIIYIVLMSILLIAGCSKGENANGDSVSGNTNKLESKESDTEKYFGIDLSDCDIIHKIEKINEPTEMIGKETICQIRFIATEEQINKIKEVIHYYHKYDEEDMIIYCEEYPWLNYDFGVEEEYMENKIYEFYTDKLQTSNSSKKILIIHNEDNTYEVMWKYYYQELQEGEYIG